MLLDVSMKTKAPGLRVPRTGAVLFANQDAISDFATSQCPVSRTTTFGVPDVSFLDEAPL